MITVIYKRFKSIKQCFYILLNRFVFHLRGYSYGNNMRIYNKLYVIGKGTITIGNNLLFTSGSSINPIARNICGSLYTSPSGHIEIGDNVGISSACIWSDLKISIGNNVNIGADSIIIDTDVHSLDYIERRNVKSKQNIKSQPIVIEDDVWIGARCQILKGVTIGARSVIGAGSIVTKNIPPDSIAAGNPCKVIRNIN